MPSKKDIPSALENFDRLPDSALVGQPVVEGLFGISGPTLWRRVKDGKLPKPRKPSPGCTRWSVGELRRGLAKA
jgi:predicted DNA-binding transcriptional regulator AlpA